ncbi:MAG: MFS transporter [Anaerolineales bacterium]
MAARPTRLRVQLATFTLNRTILNTGFRMVYPFLPVFARGLGISLQTMAWIVTARAVLGALSPVIGSLSDWRGRRWGMIAGMLLFAAGLAIVPLHPTYAVLFVGFMLATAGKMIFDPSVQAYLGDRVNYARRGLAIAITEVGWSASSLIGIPLVGLLIEARGWTSPFLPLAALAVVGAWLLWRMIPADSVDLAKAGSLGGRFGMLMRQPAALAGLAVSVAATAGNETVNIIYGAWMESSFGLNVAALGGATAIIGIAELSGEGAVAAVADRLGKKRLIGLGLALNALAALLLPVASASLAGSLIGLFFYFISFEIIIVGSIPLMTQLLPSARATLMASNVAAISLGRALGAAIGPTLFSIGLLANAGTAAALDIIALILLAKLVHVDERATS